MKRIAMLVCEKSLGRGCTGFGCMKALNERAGAFAAYEAEEVELEAFFPCCGCGRTPEQEEGLQKKIDRIVELRPDAVHVGICTLNKETKRRCGTIERMIRAFLNEGIPVIDGTHKSPWYENIGQPVSNGEE